MKFFTSNIGAKIFALLCAVFLWIYVSAGQSKVGYFPGSLSIEAKNTPEGLAAIYDEQKIKVKIQAPYEIWNKLSADNFQAYIDLNGLSEGTYDVEIKVNVNLPNVVVVEKEPSKIIVRLESIAKKEVPVEVKFDGEAKAGFVPGETTIKPEKVEVKGAKSLIEGLSGVTALIKLSGESDDFKKTVAVGVYNDKGEKLKNIEIDPQTVEIEVPIIPASQTKTVGVKVNLKGKPKSDYFVGKIEASPATIDISGADSALKSILYIGTKDVDIDGIDKDLEKNIDLVVPSGITSQTKSVKVKITLSSNKVDREITASLTYTNISSGLSVNSVTPNMIKVVVSCPSDVASSLSSDKVIITFNLQGKVAGSYFINITKDMISVPDGCAVSSWLPSAITIVLQ